MMEVPIIIETSPLQSKSITGFYMSETSVIKKLIPFWLCSCFPPLPLQEVPEDLWFCGFQWEKGNIGQKCIKYLAHWLKISNPHHATGILPYFKKSWENLWFPDVFRGYTKISVPWNMSGYCSTAGSLTKYPVCHGHFKEKFSKILKGC